MKSILTFLTGVLFCVQLCAQSPSQDKFYKVGPDACPEVINANIPGAPKLGKPMLVMGETGPVIAKGNGLAAPAFYDWDKDGKKDLLIGEFGSGVEHGNYVGNFMRVYKNHGDQNKPEFKDKFSYAYPTRKKYNNGTPLSAIHG